ncbi:metallophosphoesterase family protein [Pseudobacillus wudalianchiensis]|uniref:Phosphoesterase n=1 Tax=Pseudobacillus wudalianchiensis TaxID=1743143 RepID=A0A1B9B8E2_9BACI|nr:metallophosphoesterase [Bacillus wudalianchiensis]OCA92369.1 YfcE family phosphodiesterase [Bacillus wudalianchiensis]
MKVLVVSDSHGWSEILTELKQRYEGEVDVLIHCGDSELSADNPAIEGYVAVRGNCDTEEEFPYDIVEGVKGKRIFITHGHRYNVKMSLMKLTYKAQENGSDFVFFGHSHLLGAEKINDAIFLNPGSIAMPRGRREKTYALVEADEQQAVIRFFDETHRELTELQCVFSL